MLIFVYPSEGCLSISFLEGKAVLMFITPFKAEEPYKTDEAPLITSTWLIFSVAISFH